MCRIVGISMIAIASQLQLFPFLEHIETKSLLAFELRQQERRQGMFVWGEGEGELGAADLKRLQNY